MKYKRSSIQLIRSSISIYTMELNATTESCYYQCRTALVRLVGRSAVWSVVLPMPGMFIKSYMCTHQQRSVCGVTVAIYANTTMKRF